MDTLGGEQRREPEERDAINRRLMRCTCMRCARTANTSAATRGRIEDDVKQPKPKPKPKPKERRQEWRPPPRKALDNPVVAAAAALGWINPRTWQD